MVNVRIKNCLKSSKKTIKKLCLWAELQEINSININK